MKAELCNRLRKRGKEKNDKGKSNKWNKQKKDN